MDPIKNPFSPGAGSPPPELVGREPILEQAHILLGRIKHKRAEKSMLLTGLRGVGKTVLLNEIDRLARAEGYRTVVVEAHEDKPLGPVRARLIKKGMIYSPAHGDMAFTVPLFDEFMIRAIPDHAR